MNNFNHISIQNIFIPVIIFTLLLVVLIQYIWVGIAGIIALIFFYMYGWKYISPFFIIIFLVITSDLSDTLRIIVNNSGFFVLGFLILKEHGINLGKYPKVPSLIVWFIGFVLISLIISSLFSNQVTISFNETIRQVLFFMLIYFFYSFVKSDENISSYFIWALMIASTFIATTIIYDFIKSDNSQYILATTGLVHEGGYLNNVAAAGGIFVTGISLNLIAIISEELTSKKIKYVLIIFLILQVVALLLTNSRAAILGIIMSSIYIIAKLTSLKIRKLLLIITACTAILLIVFPNLLEVIFIFLRGDRVFSNTRYLMWQTAFDIIKDNPVLGVGPGMFKFSIYKYLPVMLGSWDEQQIRWLYEFAGLGHAHNFVLFLTSELGILGLLCSVGLPIIFFYYSNKTLKYSKNSPEVYPIVIGITAIGIGLFTRSFFESTGILTYGWITRDLPFWIAFIILIDLFQKSNNPVKVKL